MVLWRVPVVRTMAHEESGWLGYEAITVHVEEAYQRVRGGTDSLDAALSGWRYAESLTWTKVMSQSMMSSGPSFASSSVSALGDGYT
jgi:hypothetical protein